MAATDQKVGQTKEAKSTTAATGWRTLDKCVLTYRMRGLQLTVFKTASIFGASRREQRLEKDNEAMQGSFDRKETEDP